MFIGHVMIFCMIPQTFSIYFNRIEISLTVSNETGITFIIQLLLSLNYTFCRELIVIIIGSRAINNCVNITIEFAVIRYYVCNLLSFNTI